MARTLVLVLALACCSVATAHAQSHARGNTANTNEYPVRPLRTEPRIAFDIKTKYRDSGALTVSGGVLVTGNINGNGGTFGYDASNGKLLWKLKGHLRGEPAIDGNAAYVVNDNNNGTLRLAKVELKKGKVLWFVDGSDIGPHDAAPLVADGKVVLAAPNDHLTAYDAGTGKVVWDIKTYRTCSPALATSEGVLVFAGRFATEQPGLHGLDLKTGKVLWSASLTDNACPRVPAIAAGLVVARADEKLFALDLKTGAQKWKYEHVIMEGERKRRPTLREATITGGVIYTTTEHNILGFELTTGKAVFDLPLEQPSDAMDVRMAAAGGVLFVSGNAELPRETSYGSGWVYAIDLATKQTLWKFQASKVDKYNKGTWTTGHILPVDDGVYLENQSRLVKLVK
jgi:outer membrane protein assembly factor BamB